jgi:hypothetical protein
MGGVAAPGASTAFILAMMPLPMVLVFVPAARQLYAVPSPAQIAVFPADVSAGPSSTVKFLTLEEAN